jgi:molybdate transport system substrate-binding protein
MKVLSAGAVQRGLKTAANAFEKETGRQITLEFATAPVIRSRVENQDLALDLVIAPLESMREFEQQRLVAASSSVVVGSVKAGVAVRRGDWQPDISNGQRLKEELLACDAIAYTQGSSGIFAEDLIQRFGIGEVTKEKTRRLPDAGAVMKFLADGAQERAIGFGQVTAILLHAREGIKLVGPLPKGVENITTYAAGMLTRAEASEPGQQFLEFLLTPLAKAAFQAAGVEASGEGRV